MDHISRPPVMTERGRLSLAKLLLQPIPLISIASSLLILGFALWVGQQVHTTSYRLTEKSLTGIRNANAAALRIWLRNQQDTATRIAGDNLEGTWPGELLRRYPAQQEVTLADLKESHAYFGLEQVPPMIPTDRQHRGWALLNLDGVVLLASEPSWLAFPLPISRHAWREVTRGIPTVSHPFAVPASMAAQDCEPHTGRTFMAAIAPIQDNSRVLGGLAILLDPLDQFSNLLAHGQFGDSAESYVFNRQGILLSKSRSTTRLRDVGLLPEDTAVHELLNIELRDPEANLMIGEPATQPRSTQSLTRMAERATRGGTGVDSEGYNNYLGVPVVGAWTWLDEYELGLATEVEMAEVYRPLAQLRYAFWLFAGILSATSAGFIGLSVRNQLLEQRARSADHRMRRLGNYELLEPIGSGGMGMVYRGRHQLLRRPVAVKVLEASSADARSIKRFEREVQRTSELQHPNTVQIYDYGITSDSTFFYVMELIDGLDLTQLVETYGPQPPGRVIHILTQVCGSLAEAHERGLVHRDIKPGNLLLSAPAGVYDYVKVVDFGLVKETAGVDANAVTRVESLTGTPLYMSPEAIRDATAVDDRADLYSLSAVGYYLLTGHPLFDADTAVDICLLQVSQMPVRPSERLGKPLPDDLQELLMDCLHKLADQRPQSVSEFATRLRACEDAKTWSPEDATEWWTEVYDKQPLKRTQTIGLLPNRDGDQPNFQPGNRTVVD